MDIYVLNTSKYYKLEIKQCDKRTTIPLMSSDKCPLCGLA